MINWLPGLIKFEDYDNIWDRYLEVLYEAFKADFVYARPTFRGRKLGLKKHPKIRGKEATFWHFIQEGKIESNRYPNIRRCERIKWPSPIIEHEKTDFVYVWENERSGKRRILLYLVQENYLVVLAIRKGYILPWTAYIVDKEHRRKKLLKEYENYKKNRSHPQNN